MFGLLLSPIIIFLLAVFLIRGFSDSVTNESVDTNKPIQSENAKKSEVDISTLFENKRSSEQSQDQEVQEIDPELQPDCSLGDLKVKSGTNVSYTICVD